MVMVDNLSAWILLHYVRQRIFPSSASFALKWRMNLAPRLFREVALSADTTYRQKDLEQLDMAGFEEMVTDTE